MNARLLTIGLALGAILSMPAVAQTQAGCAKTAQAEAPHPQMAQAESPRPQMAQAESPRPQMAQAEAHGAPQQVAGIAAPCK